MRLEPLQAIACALIGAGVGLGAAAWWFLGCPKEKS